MDDGNLAGIIDTAFAHVPILEYADILAPGSRSEDAAEMAAEFAGKHWSVLSRETLFLHREMLAALSPIGYQAYIPAYLKASLVDGQYDYELREYTLFTLMSLREDRRDEVQVRLRLSRLSKDQREAIEHFVHRFVGELMQAQRVLDDWKSSTYFNT